MVVGGEESGAESGADDAGGVGKGGGGRACVAWARENGRSRVEDGGVDEAGAGGEVSVSNPHLRDLFFEV